MNRFAMLLAANAAVPVTADPRALTVSFSCAMISSSFVRSCAASDELLVILPGQTRKMKASHLSFYYNQSDSRLIILYEFSGVTRAPAADSNKPHSEIREFTYSLRAHPCVAARMEEQQHQTATCAFCLECSGPTVIACGCKGGTENVHPDCLDKWMNSGAAKCAACRQLYRDSRRFSRLIRQFRRMKAVVERLLDKIGMVIGTAYAILCVVSVGTWLMQMFRGLVLWTSEPCAWFDCMVAVACVVWILCRYNIRIERNI